MISSRRGQALLVVGKDGFADDLVLLERAQDVAVVGDGQALLPRDQGGQGAHLVADLDERDAGAVGQRLGRHVHAVLS